jgi:hypothetical protein
MPYHVGKKGSYGCSGYPALKDDGTVMGCHKTRAEAAGQIYAINRSEGNISDKADWETVPPSDKEPFDKAAPCWDGYTQRGMKPGKGGKMVPNCIPVKKAEDRIREGDFVMLMTKEDGPIVGQVEHIMIEGGTYGQPGNPYAVESTPENPAVAVRMLEEEDGVYFYTPYSVGALYSDLVPIDMPEIDMQSAQDIEDEMEMIDKADTYSPPAGARAAARKAIKFKEDGKAGGAGTAVGWTRARQLANGESLSLSTVKRMYSYFSRHEVDKKGKDWANQSNPSNGYIMWLAWGGDAGYSWSRGIVNRMKDKALFSDFGQFINKSQRMEEIFKRDRSMETRRRLAESGEAMPDGSYPIVTVEDLRNAIQAFGRTDNPAATKEHIKRRARALGRTDLLPENWK